jgi:peroxiredoxin
MHPFIRTGNNSGAFTPTCSATHLPGYEAAYDEIKTYGVDEVYCTS